MSIEIWEQIGFSALICGIYIYIYIKAQQFVEYISKHSNLFCAHSR